MKKISGYLTTNDYILERNGDYEATRGIADLFEFTTEKSDGNGNLCSDVFFNPKNKKPYFQTPKKALSTDFDSAIRFYRAIPSSLLMYRLACMFQGNITTHGQEGYKFTWSFKLKHKATGTLISFGEWKGGALFWTEFYSSTDKRMPKEFKKDLLKLLEVLVSDTCAHPYDGLVAGSVA